MTTGGAAGLRLTDLCRLIDDARAEPIAWKVVDKVTSGRGYGRPIRRGDGLFHSAAFGGGGGHLNVAHGAGIASTDLSRLIQALAPARIGENPANRSG